MQKFDVVVVGGGHAGIEAANASACIGVNTAIMTMELEAIGRMSCNPAIGGVAKGQIVRDIDALGGVMGVLSDRAGIHFRMLNNSKGPAVWGPRAQQDMDLYSELAQDYLKKLSNLSFIQDQLFDFIWNPNGEYPYLLKGETGQEYLTKNVIITSGTFLGAVMYTGLDSEVGGRFGEAAATKLADTIKGLGIQTRRLKTGTPARIKEASIDFSQVEVQHGDPDPFKFSFRTPEGVVQNKITCWITRTSEQTHEALRKGFDRSPMFTGKIKGLGPRYCPSIEDKIARFAEKDSHQIFLEPEGIDSGRIYINGFSSSLPKEVQHEAISSLPGLQNMEVIRYGYAVEYDAIYAKQLHPTMEMKEFPGLYFAGQVCGTSGYEEAAGQGMVAGINAAQNIKGLEPFILGRADSYIGVMIDDLVSMDIGEPYRMFTSRAEYRLFLRQDNAEERLMKKGYDLGLVSGELWKKYQAREELYNNSVEHLKNTTVSFKKANPYLSSINSAPLKESVKAQNLVKRPGVEFDKVLELSDFPYELSKEEKVSVYAHFLYQGFYDRQMNEIERQKKLENLKIPQNFSYMDIEALSIEARQKLSEFKPLTIGQAQKVAGVRPTDISTLIYFIDHKLKQTATAEN